MTEAAKLAKAQLWKLPLDGKDPNDTPASDRMHVQFNPETLKVSYSNQIKPEGNGGSTASMLYVGRGTTKLSVQLWFDVTAPMSDEVGKGVTDVRALTRKVALLITPECQQVEKVENEKKVTVEQCVPPGVRFLWGTFHFDGIMESLEESLEFFSPEGKPLRASVSLSLSQQKIQFNEPGSAGGQPPGAGPPGGQPPGTSPLAQAPSGSSLQKLAAGMGQAAKWQRIAQANGIENPRLLSPGQLIDMNAPKLR